MSFTRVKKFWVPDPRVEGKGGHPRVLIAYKVAERSGFIEYVAATWNPDDGLPFDRKFANDKVDGLMRGHRGVQVGLNTTKGEVASILQDVVDWDGTLYGMHRARLRACEAELKRRESVGLAGCAPRVGQRGWRGWCFDCQRYTARPDNKGAYNYRVDQEDANFYSWLCSGGCGRAVDVLRRQPR